MWSEDILSAYSPAYNPPYAFINVFMLEINSSLSVLVIFPILLGKFFISYTVVWTFFPSIKFDAIGFSELTNGKSFSLTIPCPQDK